MIKLFVGLGNPGPQYEDTRHNVGFWWIDALAEQLKIQLSPERGYFGLMARATVQGHTFWLLEPQTFMNASGKSVAALARFYKIQPEEILVVHDELDFPPGQTKLKHGGSHGGHNGLRDIHAQLGSSDYWRLRIGIGHPGIKAEVVHWVLGRPAPGDRRLIENAIEHGLASFGELTGGAMDKATQQINTPVK
jgi:PTH1 family peptidyl-tRNA hydrolase